MSDSKASKLRPPSKIGRPCCTVPPKPALPPSPPRSTMNPMEPVWENHGRRTSEAGLRRGSDTSVVLTEDTDSFIIGDRVWVGGTKPGSIAYIGETQFAPGDWAGVVLDDPIGKNDGSVAGSRYFQCEPKRGIFSRLTRLTRQPLHEAMTMSPTGEKTPTSPPESSRGMFNKSMSPSLNASTTSLASVSHKDLKLGDRVIVSSSQGSKTGVLRFVGATEFAPGEWCGVELDDAVGKNDGTVGDIRYFECRPKHGLFAPLHKVSRSPSSRRTSTMCAIHKPTGASMNSSIRRLGGSRESLASMSSVASTNASVVTRGTNSGSRRPGLRTSTHAPSSMQEILKEKQQEIEMLRKERDFERQRISKAANQADNAEQTVIALKQEYDKYRDDMEKTVREAQLALAQLLDEKNTLKVHLEQERQKSEDLLFRFEEESVNKDDIQNQNTDQCVVNTLNESKLKDLERQLTEERERVIQLEQENTKLFEAEEEIAKLRTQLTDALNRETKDLQDIENRNMCLEEAKITLEQQMLERNNLIEQYASQIRDFEARSKERDQESAARKQLETDLQKNSDEMKQILADKSALIEKMQHEHEIVSEKLKGEIERSKRTVENILADNNKEKESLAEKHRKIIDEKENTMRAQTERLEAELERHSLTHKTALEKLRSDSVEQINQLSENFKKQLAEKDLQINNICKQLEEKVAEIERLVEELANQRNICLSKDEELKKLLERVQELSEQLKASEDANRELKDRMDNFQSQNDENFSSLAREKQKLEQSVASLLASSNNSSAELEKLNEDLKTKERELSELRDAKAAEIAQLRRSFESQIEDKTKYITEISADISEKTLRLRALETEIADLKSIIANKDEEIKNLLEKTSELNDAVTLSEQTKTNLESELRMYEVNIAELNQKLSRAEEKSTQLTEQKAKLEGEIADVINTSTNSSDQLVKYNEDLRGKEKELDQLRDHSIQVENSLASAEIKIASILQELFRSNESANQCRAEANELKDKLTIETRTKNELSKEIEQLKTKEQLLSETVEGKEKLNAELNIKNAAISELTGQLESTKENILALNEKYSSFEKEASEKTKRLENISVAMKEEIVALQKELEKSAEMSDKLAADRLELQKSVELLTANVGRALEEKTKLEASILDKNAQMERCSAKIAEIKKEKEEAIVASSTLSAKYNETLLELALIKSTLTSAESENSLELSNLKEQLSRAVSNDKELTERLKNHEKSAEESEAKLKELEEILRKKETEKLESIESLRKAKDSIKKLQEQLESRRNEFEEELKMHDNKNTELNKQIELLNREMSDVKNELNEKNRAIAENEKNAESLKKKLEELAASSKSKETEAESVAKLADNVEARNKNLQQEIMALNADLSSKDSRVEELMKELDSLRDVQAKMAKDEEQNAATRLEAERARIDKLDKENEKLRANKEFNDKALRAEQERIESLTKLLRETEISTAEKLRTLENQLSSEKMEAAQLKEKQNRLEKDNKQIEERMNRTLKELKTIQENNKNNQETENYPTNLKIHLAGGDMNQNSDSQNDSKKLSDENEMYKGQIEFLNSVIVDMQRKNEKLTCKIQVLEIGVPANEADDYSRSTLDKRTAAPRMFCDICDQFDLHETEDCPRQAQDFEEPVRPTKSPKKPSVERPYCENCEVFGHDVLNCDDAETF